MNDFIIGKFYKYGVTRGMKFDFWPNGSTNNEAFEVVSDSLTNSGKRAKCSSHMLTKMILDDVAGNMGGPNCASNWYREVNPDGSEIINSVPPTVAPVAIKVKTKRTPRQLFLVTNKNGMTHKALVNIVNKRGVKSFGLSPLQSLSRYEDQTGNKIDIKDAVAFKLVPYSLRLDKKTGKPRLDKQIGYSKED